MIVSAAKASDAADVLGVELVSLTSNALSKAYRAKTKECHPDHHGNDKLQQWSRVSWAKECLEHWLKHHPAEEHSNDEPQGVGDCRACKGTGRVVVPQVKRFGAPLTMVCVICRGFGSIIPEENDHD
jgi:DnaJ-class molecular chaperone